MRDIKFRVWDSEKKRMLPIQRHSFKTGKSMPYGWNMEYVFDNLMQYTGLKDKNGKEIYEGDIIKDVDYGYMTCIFKEGTFMWYSKEKFGIRFMNYVPTVEIIGNIYEDKHLLEEV